MVSSTVTVPVHEVEFPLWSVTETVTTFAPRFTQVNAVCEAVNETIEQLSVGNPAGGPLNETVPAPFKNTVGFWHTKVGLVVSTTATEDKQEDEFPWLSVTVNVTGFAPRFAQV